MRFFERLKKKHYIQCGLAILLTSIFLYLTSSLWLGRGIIVSFDAETVKDFTYQVFYIEEKGKGFNPKPVSKGIKLGKHKVEIVLPIENLLRFRLDIGINPEKVIIKNLKLIGSKTIKLNYNEFEKNQIDSFMADEEMIILSSNKVDPYITYKSELNLPAGAIISWYTLIIWATLSFLVLNKLVRYLAKFKLEEKYSRIDIIMLVVFFGLCFIPISRISDAEKSEQENRMLTKYNPLWQDGQFNYQFGTDFEKWYNDRFLGRDFILTLYNKLKYHIAPLSGNDKVLIGKESWLFLKDNNGMRNYANITELSEKKMQKGLDYLRAINEWCKKNGKNFYYVIAPDKSKIYGEYYRLIYKQRSDDYSLGNQFKDYIKKNSDINVIYLYDILMKNKDKGLLYYKHDTHWTYLGGYYGYKAIMEVLNMPAKSFEFKDISSLHDLEKLLNGLVDKDNEQYKIGEVKNYCNVKGRAQSVCTNSEGNKRLFMLRDSFADGYIRYLSANFNKIQTHHYDNYQFSLENLEFIKNNADVVIMETVERLIPFYILSKSVPQTLIKKD